MMIDSTSNVTSGAQQLQHQNPTFQTAIYMCDKNKMLDMKAIVKTETLRPGLFKKVTYAVQQTQEKLKLINRKGERALLSFGYYFVAACYHYSKNVDPIINVWIALAEAT